ncbi:MAG: thioredoxin fold domain-containing protein [Pseudomonadota bacterium]
MRLTHPLPWYWLIGLFALFLQSPAWALGSQPFIKDSFLDLREDLADATRAGRLLMVVYEQEGCPYCAQLHQVHFQDRAIVERIRQGFDVIQLDLWGGREVTTFSGESMSEKAFARQSRVQFSPTLVFYDAKGREIHRMTGLHKPDRFKAELDYLMSRSYEKMSFREYSAKQAAKPRAQGLIKEPFFAQTDDLKALSQRAAADNKVLALLFEQANCEDCQRLHDRNFMDGDTVKLLTDHFVMVQIDLAGNRKLRDLNGKPSTEAKLARSLNVQQAPTMLFFDSRGQEILRYEHHLIPEHFANLLTFLGSHAYRQHASFIDWLRALAAERATAN